MYISFQAKKEKDPSFCAGNKEWFSCDIAREEGVVPYLRGGLEMLDILPNTHHLACVCELLLDCIEGRDGAGPVALAE